LITSTDHAAFLVLATPKVVLVGLLAYSSLQVSISLLHPLPQEMLPNIVLPTSTFSRLLVLLSAGDINEDPRVCKLQIPEQILPILFPI
jgi:hypothetical protein